MLWNFFILRFLSVFIVLLLLINPKLVSNTYSVQKPLLSSMIGVPKKIIACILKQDEEFCHLHLNYIPLIFYIEFHFPAYQRLTRTDTLLLVQRGAQTRNKDLGSWRYIELKGCVICHLNHQHSDRWRPQRDMPHRQPQTQSPSTAVADVVGVVRCR